MRERTADPEDSTGDLIWIVAKAIIHVVKLITALFTTLLLNTPTWACSGCRVQSDGVEDATVMAGFAFSWGVVTMLAFLFALCSGLGWFVMKTIKAVDARHSSAR